MLMETLFNNIKSLISDSVIKIERKAREFETLESIRNSDMYISAIQKTDRYELYGTFYIEAVQAAFVNNTDITFNQMLEYASNPSTVPMIYRERILEEQRNYIIDNYIEINNYYRMLTGLPDIEETEYITITPEMESEYSINVSNNTYIHFLSDIDIYLIRESGLMDKLIEDNPTKKYLKYLGDKSINIIDARLANNFGILRIDKSGVPDEFYNSFIQTYEQCREYFMTVLYSSNYGESYNLYDNFIGLAIMVMTIQRLLSKTFKFGIQRDFYDWTFVQNMYEMYNVPFVESLPLEYHVIVLKNLNNLLRYKSTDKVLYDIASLLGYSRLNIFKYYLVKSHKLDEYNNPIFIDNIDKPIYRDRVNIVANVLNHDRLEYDRIGGGSIIRLTDNKIFTYYNTQIYPWYMIFRIITVNDDNTVSYSSLGYDTRINFGSIDDRFFKPVRISDTKVLLCYTSNNGNGNSMILNINGNVMTLRENHEFYINNNVGINTGLRDIFNIIRLTENKALVCYRDPNNSGYGTVKILNIDGDNITSSDSYVFNTYSTNSLHLELLSDNKIIIIYGDSYSSPYKVAQILTIDNNSVTFGNKMVLNVGSNNISGAIFSTEVLSNNRILITYREQIESSPIGYDRFRGFFRIVTMDNDNIVDMGEKITLVNQVGTIRSLKISDNRIILYYTESTDYMSYPNTQVIDIDDENNVNRYISKRLYEFDDHPSGLAIIPIRDNKLLAFYNDAWGPVNYLTSNWFILDIGFELLGYEPDYENMYDVYFHRINAKEKNLALALQEEIGKLHYSDVIADDPYWWEDGDLAKLKYETAYNWVETKYISLNLMYKMTDMLFELTYAFRMLIDRKEDVNKYLIDIPKIYSQSKFRVFDVIVFTIALMCKLHGFTPGTVTNPSGISHIYGFNFNEETINYIKSIITDNSQLIDQKLLDYFNNLTIEKASDVNDVFENLREYNSFIIDKMRYSTNIREYNIYKKIFKISMISETQVDMFTIENEYGESWVASSYAEYLEYSQPILYEILYDVEVDDISIMVNHITSQLNKFMKDLKYLYIINDNNNPIFDAIVALIKFFKSYTVDINTINVIYLFDSGFYNLLKMIDDIGGMTGSMTITDTLNQAYSDTTGYPVSNERVGTHSNIKTNDNVHLTDSLSITYGD